MLKTSVLLTCLLVCAVQAQEQGVPANAPHIVTNGNAEIRVPADMATLDFSISLLEKDTLKARQAVDTRVAAFVNALEAAGFKRQDLVAGNLQLSPEYLYADNQKPRLNGYRATRGVSVRLYQLERVSQIIDVALKAGLESVQRIQYGVRDETRYLNQVRLQAIADSKSRANELAKAYSMTLGKVYSIQYNTTAPQAPMAMGKMMMAEASPADSYIADDIRFSDSVSVVFNLD
jgi:uncharacterized protein YggE